MLRRTLSNKISFPKNVWLGSYNKFCDNITKDNGNGSQTTKESVNNVEPTYDTEEVTKLLEQSATYTNIGDTNWTTTPYPKDITIPIKTKRQQIDPTTTSVLLFPGQGTIKVGMIKKYIHYPAAKELFEITNEIVGYDLLNICLNGPQDKLDRTEFNQIATVVSSLAALEKVREDRPSVFNNCVAAAGYSVGEITALILAGVLSFEDGIRLVHVRGKAMQQASGLVPQGMMSITITPKSKVSEACREAEKWAMDMGVEKPICRVAIFLCTEKKIIAGNNEALEYIEKNKKQFSLANVTRLPVSGGFHTPLMEPSLKHVSRMINSLTLDEPRCKIYSNYKAEPYKNTSCVKKYICKQIVSPVKWEQCIQRIYNRPQEMQFPTTYDIGSEGRMRTILKFINAKASRACTVI